MSGRCRALQILGTAAVKITPYGHSGTLEELAAAGKKETLEFFFVRLKDVSAPTVNRHALLCDAFHS